MDELRHCPFCFSEDVYIGEIRGAFDGYDVYCRTCGAHGPQKGTKRAAAKAWNNPLLWAKLRSETNE